MKVVTIWNRLKFWQVLDEIQGGGGGRWSLLAWHILISWMRNRDWVEILEDARVEEGVVASAASSAPGPVWVELPADPPLVSPAARVFLCLCLSVFVILSLVLVSGEPRLLSWAFHKWVPNFVFYVFCVILYLCFLFACVFVHLYDSLICVLLLVLYLHLYLCPQWLSYEII